MFHHGTIRAYTAALIDVFNGLEIQYTDSTGTVQSKNIPLRYSTREKCKVMDEYTEEQVLSGNYNVLPRANIALSTMIRAEQRMTNKNVKISTVKNEDNFEFMYNSVPYEFTFELAIICRGMNEATMIIEQIAPRFNPTLNIDVWDSQNLNEPTRVPVKLLDIGIEGEDYDETTTNLVTVNVGLSIMGNLYPPIKTTNKIKEFKIYLNETAFAKTYTRKTIMGWDVTDEGTLQNEEIINAEETEAYAPEIISINAFNVQLGENDVTVIFDDKDNKFDELVFTWDVLLGDATIEGNSDNAVLTVNGYGDVEVQVTITDIFGNYKSMQKTFNIPEPVEGA